MLLGGLPILAKLIAFVATPLGLKALAIAVVGASALALFRKIDENIAGGKVKEFEDALRKQLDDVGGIKLSGGGTGAVLLDEKGDEILMLPAFDLPNATGPSVMGREYDPSNLAPTEH